MPSLLSVYGENASQSPLAGLRGLDISRMPSRLSSIQTDRIGPGGRRTPPYVRRTLSYVASRPPLPFVPREAGADVGPGTFPFWGSVWALSPSYEPVPPPPF